MLDNLVDEALLGLLVKVGLADRRPAMSRIGETARPVLALIAIGRIVDAQRFDQFQIGLIVKAFIAPDQRLAAVESGKPGHGVYQWPFHGRPPPCYTGHLGICARTRQGA
jgi:hypothetical protein